MLALSIALVQQGIDKLPSAGQRSLAMWEKWLLTSEPENVSSTATNALIMHAQQKDTLLQVD